MTLGNLHTIINDLSELIAAEVRVIGPGSPVLQAEKIAPSTSHTFSLGPIGVSLVLIKQGEEVSVPLQKDNQVIYASDIFPSESLQTIINDFDEPIQAEVRVISGPPTGKAQEIPSASSLTFALKPLDIKLVVIAKIGGKVAEANFPINLRGGKQVKYASELFPAPY